MNKTQDTKDAPPNKGIHSTFLKNLSDYLSHHHKNLEQKSDEEKLYAVFQQIPKPITQLQFYRDKLSYHHKTSYSIDISSPFFKLFSMGLYKVRILKIITYPEFLELLSVLTSTHRKKLLKIDKLNPVSWGCYFKKNKVPSFKSNLNKVSSKLRQCDDTIKKTDTLFTFLKALKTRLNEVILKPDLEAMLLTLMKNQSYKDALNLIEIHQNYQDKNTKNCLWSNELIDKFLNHLKFFKILSHLEEDCENLLASIPTRFFFSCFDRLDQFTLHPNKAIITRSLARIHRGDTGFFKQSLILQSNDASSTLYQSTVKKLLLIVDAKINPETILNIQNLSIRNKAQLLIPQANDIKTCSWLIENLKSFNPSLQEKVIYLLKQKKEIYIGQLLINHVVKKNFLDKEESYFRELIYDTILLNAPKVLIQFIQNNRLKKSFFYKSNNFQDYVNLERVLKKNQYFAQSLTLKKIQRITQSYKLRFLRKLL